MKDVPGSSLNTQPTKELRYFQRVITQTMHIKWLLGYCDHWEWENEKKDAIIEMRDQEIVAKDKEIADLKWNLEKVNHEFKKYVKAAKEFRRDTDKMESQQQLINSLKKQVSDLESRMATRDRMMKILEQQQRKNK